MSGSCVKIGVGQLRWILRIILGRCMKFVFLGLGCGLSACGEVIASLLCPLVQSLGFHIYKK